MASIEFRQLCFNELTLTPLCEDTTIMYNRVKRYANTFSLACQKYKTKLIRYQEDLSSIRLSEDISLHDFCTRYKNDPAIILLLSTHTMPQIDPSDELLNKQFSKTEAYVKIDDSYVLSDGYAAAFVYATPSIGFASCPTWEKSMHDLHVISEEQIFDVKWPCFTSPDHLEREDSNQWCLHHNKITIELVTTPLTFEQKRQKIKISDDHGSEVLYDHAEKLCHSEYVIGIIGSLPYKPNYRSYILNTTADGIIDIVLFWDDRGISMRVKTTGRNIQETALIADILCKKYSK